MADTPKKSRSKTTELDLLKAQVTELTEALQRERADAMNVRRRADEDRLKMASYFKASVVKELLPFIDNFERALRHTPTSKDKAVNDFLTGLASVNKQLWQILEDLGMKRIKTVGEVFDPKYHEAVQMDNASEGSKEIVIEEFVPGFVLDDEVVRHAMVKVAMR